VVSFRFFKPTWNSGNKANYSTPSTPQAAFPSMKTYGTFYYLSNTSANGVP